MTTTQPFEDLLTADALSALMRSTWTWDDRALRRDLAMLLVDLDAARSAAGDDDTADHADALRACAFVSAADFVAAVLGPLLVADTGNPLRQQFVAPALDRARFARIASSAIARVREQTERYVTQAAGVDYPAESTWLTPLSNAGQHGLATAMRAYGYGLSAAAYFGNAGLAWQTLRALGADSDAAAGYVKAIETGAVSAALAAAEQTGSWDPALVRTKAVRKAGGWQLSGLKRFVAAAEGADVYFVVARSTAGPSLFAVERSVPGLQVTPQDVVDETRPLHQVELSDTPARLISTEGGGGRLMMTAIDLATTALAAEQVGLIDKSMRMLVEGNPSTSTQTEVTLHHVTALSLWRRAVGEQSAGSPHAPAAATAAHIGCSRAAVQTATMAAELLGPSPETDALLRRALSASLLFGGPALWHERLLDRLGV